METTEIKKYSFSDMIFAVMSIGLGILSFYTAENGFALGCGIFFTLAVIFEITYGVLKNGKKIEPKGVAMMLLCIIFSFGFAFGERNFLLQFINFFVCIWAFFYGTYVLFDNRSEKFIGKMLLFDTLKAIILMPLSSLGSLFGSLTSQLKKGGSKKIGYAFLGLFLALVPSLIVSELLSQNDPAFGALWEAIFRNIDISRIIVIGIVSLFVASIGFSLSYSSKEKKHSDVLTEDSLISFLENSRVIDNTIVYFTIIPLIVIYISFLISQLSYFTSAFSGILPEGETFSSCARRGFFELCAVAMINGIAIFLMGIFTKRNESKKSTSQKVFSTILSLLTLGLLSVAMAKMFLYIQEYGLTQKRFYTVVIMGVMSIIFILTIIKQYYEKLNAILISFAVCVFVFGAVIYIKPCEYIAEYNIERYLDGSFETLDINSFYMLSEGAGVRKLIEIYDKVSDEEVKRDIVLYISSFYYDNSFRHNNFLGYYSELDIVDDAERFLIEICEL